MTTDRPYRPTAHDEPAAPDFGVPVPASGYRWWYIDGISDDGNSGVVVIAFIGSVFSPYYFGARQRGPANPLDFCAINVGLYRRRGKRWAMTERGEDTVRRDARSFRVGPSRLGWDDDGLTIEIRERAAPFGQRLAGRIRVRPDYLNPVGFALDPGGRHTWRQVAPGGRIEVAMTSPAFRFHGSAYFDTNAGSRALEEDFLGWNWSRHTAAGRTALTYSATLLNAAESALALDFDGRGRMTEGDVPPTVALPATGWRVGRSTRSHGRPRVIRTLEDTPFYARSLLLDPEATDRSGTSDAALPVMHESLSLARFRSPWVRLLLPFRMPRRAGRR